MHTLRTSADTATRLDAARAFLVALPAEAEVVVLAPSTDAGHDLCRGLALRHGARFGLRRSTLHRFATELATVALVAADQAPASHLALTALVARVIHRLGAAGSLHHYQAVATCPGFAPALVQTLQELRLHHVHGDMLADLPAIGPDLQQLLLHLDAELLKSAMADTATIYRMALQAVAAFPPLPVLLLDLPLRHSAEVGLLSALAQRSPLVLATAADGDDESIRHLQHILQVPCSPLAPGSPPSSLASLKKHLFEASHPDQGPLDDTVSLSSWPGEARECLEIARGLQQAATAGVPFDRMAVFLHSPAAYGPHLEEACMRAGIPAFFTQGTRRPHPAGRALLALLHCADEGLSAERFAEYLSLSQVPSAQEAADWVPPDHDLLPENAADDPERPDDPAYIELQGNTSVDSPPAPWRWEQLLMDATVIGGLDRWERRLRGWSEELALQQAAVAADHPARAEAIGRSRADLAQLQGFALPLLRQLAHLPRHDLWAVWLTALRSLAQSALKDPDAILRKLEELQAMGSVGPVKLDEVLLVLASELRDITVRPMGRRYGAVYIAPTDMARGLEFDVVFIPGLAEKIFPHKIVEDPILLDTDRKRLPVGLETQAQRVALERLSLRLAIGTAVRQIYLSYPRLDVEQARPRVPSFYSLEVIRAAEGRLPGYEQLNRRTIQSSGGRLGWPAPERPDDAIDEAEYDLALLAPLLYADPSRVAGTAAYLMSASPHLSRSLRARWGRSHPRWTYADGLVKLDPVGQEALQRHQLENRSFSPTSLENFAACPYRFYLNALVRLSPRQVPVAIEHMDPLTRGSLVHEVQFDILSRLRGEHRLPLQDHDVADAVTLADQLLEERARQYEEKLAPAIPRVWEDAVNMIRSDIRQWLTLQVGQVWIPERFELAFGLSDRARTQQDPASVPEAVRLPIGIQVRGSIDLVERHPNGQQRATDYKTGRVKARKNAVVQGGEILQPLVYAMVCEERLPGQVVGGRLYYCTTDGEFKEFAFPLDGDSRDTMHEVVSIIGEALQTGFLPAAPFKRACQYCDFLPVCGRHEEARTAMKPEIPSLQRLRDLP